MKKIIPAFITGIAIAASGLWAVAANLTANNSTDDCADGTGGLQQCLNVASENNEPDIIRTLPGQYTDTTYIYPADGSHDSQDVTLMNDQTDRPVVNGANSDQGMQVDLTNPPSGGFTFTVQGFIFQDGANAIEGGGLEMDSEDGNIVVDSCDFLSNAASAGGGLNVDIDDGGTLTVTNSVFRDNDATNGDGGGAQLQTDSGGILFEGNLLELNDAVSDGDGNGGGAAISSFGGTINIQGNTFDANTTQDQGGGLWADINDVDGDITINANLATGNTSRLEGGGIFANVSFGNLTLTNNIVAGNTSQNSDGGGMHPIANGTDSVLFVINNTIFGNQAPQGDGGGLAAILNDSTNTGQIYNNIVYGNSGGGNGADIYSNESRFGSPGGTINLFNNDFSDFYSECVDGGGCTGTVNEVNNIDEDPDFVNSAGGDFHLLATSPAIDTGELNPPAPVGLPSPDFDGVARPQGPLPDMGALEFQVIPTPSPTPTPTATPIPPPPLNPSLEGSGCSLGNLAATSGLGWVLPLATGWVFFRSARKRKLEDR